MALMVAPIESKVKGTVYGIEYIKELIPLSLENLKKDERFAKMLESKQIIIQHGDGWKGLPEEGPFNAIHVGAAAKGKFNSSLILMLIEIPKCLIEQLAKPGRMIIPVGEDSQYLTQVDKSENGEISIKQLMPVIFVPLVK